MAIAYAAPIPTTEVIVVLQGIQRYVFAGACVGLIAAMLLASPRLVAKQGLSQEATEATAATIDPTREAKESACRAEVDAALPGKLGELPRSQDPMCRQWLTEYARTALTGNCWKKTGIEDLDQWKQSCVNLQKIRTYCPSQDWPVDALKPSVRYACGLA